MSITLDEYDKKIIKYLQEDASISNIDLSKKIGLAPSSCLLRVKNLKEQKVIKQYTAMVDERILGYDITCFAKVAMQPLNSSQTQSGSQSPLRQQRFDLLQKTHGLLLPLRLQSLISNIQVLFLLPAFFQQS